MKGILMKKLLNTSHLTLKTLAALSSFLLLTSSFAASIKYPITVISGGVTGYVDTIILPTGLAVSNLPGGGSMLVATGLSTTAGSGGAANFSTTSNYATNAGTATFASNSGSLNGLPASSYATNFVGLTFYVRKEGKDTNTGAKENDPLLTLSNAVSRTTSNVNPITTYSFGSLSTANLTNKTFTFNGTTLTWLGTTNAANQILITSTGTTQQKIRSNLTNLMISVSNNISLPGATLAVSTTPSFIIVANTGVTYAVSNDMTSYMTSSSNTAVTVSNLGPAQIFVGPGTFLEPALTLPPQVNLIGAGINSTIITNAGTNPGLTMTASNVLSDLAITEPAAGGQAITVGYDCILKWVRGYSPEDGPIGGGGNITVDHCIFTSKGDCFGASPSGFGVLSISDSEFHSIGPQDGYAGGAGARGNGVRINGPAVLKNCLFDAGGNQYNAAVYTADGGALTNSLGVTNTINLYRCTLLISNNVNSVAISNDANCIVTEYGCDYDHQHVVGPLLHGIGPYTIAINATSDSGGVVTGVYPAGKAILNANFFPTNAAGRYAFANSFSGTNTVTFTVYTNGAACAACAVVGPSTGYEQ
jgi:hypothetical protein